MSRCARLGVMLVAIGAAVAPACGESDGGDRGSETHWLGSCDSDEACVSSLKCVCGTCTLTCTGSAECRDLGSRATCAPSSAVNALCPGSVHAKSLCLATCETATDCDLGKPCMDGVCSPRVIKSVSDAAAGGTSGGDGATRDGMTGGRGGEGAAGGDASVDARAPAGGGGATSALDAAHEGGGKGGARSIPDAGFDAGNVECQDGFHVVSNGQCRPILFADDFESGRLPGPWQLWRRTFDETGGRIDVGNGPRPGFDYGAAGHGRSAVLATHVGDSAWTDYRLDFDAEVLPAGTFDPYSLSPCTRRFSFYFRSQLQTESWNDPLTSYAIGVETKTCDEDIKGTVSMGSFHRYYCPGIGWGCSTAGEGRALVDTNTAALVDGPNHYTVEVVGNEVKFWVNGTAIFDYVDDVVPYPTGASPITSGGISFEYVWELMGWADNVVVTDMR